MITHNLSFSINTDGRSAVSGTQTETGSSETTIRQNVPSGYTDLAVAFSASALQSVILLANQNMSIQVGGTDEIQQIATTGTVTAGTFTVTFGASTSAAIQWNAAATAVQAALEAMASIGTGNVSCAGGPLPATPVTITFKGAKGRQNVAQITTTDSLTGGSTSISTTTAGVAPDATIALLAGSPLAWSRSQAYFANPFPASVSAFRINSTTANRLQAKFLIA